VCPSERCRYALARRPRLSPLEQPPRGHEVVGATEIERLRDQPRAAADGIPARQRATAASLRQRLETLRAENERLREENTNLKAGLALAYGRQRATG
jgi:hypothetical protein